MERFALKVDLSAFFNNVYEKVMILVDPQWGNVSKAEKRLRKMFKIDCDIGFKNEEGFYIPSEEPIEILKHVHFLIAFNKDLTSGGRLQNQSDQVQQEVVSIKTVEPIATSEFVRKKKRSRKVLNEVSFATSTPTASLAKRLKGVDTIVPVATKDKAVTQFSKDNGYCTTDNNTSNPVEKTAKSNVNALSITTDNNTSDHHKSAKDVTKDSNQLSSRSHIFYNESGDEVNSSENEQPENQKKEIVFSCNLADSSQKKPRFFRIGMEKQKTNSESNGQFNENGKKSQPPSPISILENITLVHGKSIPIKDAPIESNKDQSRNSNEQIISTEVEKTNSSNTIERSKVESSELTQFTESLISCDESAVIELNESENASCSVKNSQQSYDLSSHTQSTDITEQSVKTILSGASDLTDLPCVGDLLLFKLKLINGNISNLFVGKCEYVNKRTKALKLHITDGLSQIPLIPKKFASNLDDSIDLRNINIKTMDMVDPKVVRS